ncbi:MAG TPA: peptide ABC transporter substrate-binding protein [Anaerolineae bacterium]|nr:peptide ABC transporter substrate-binding protein [Anaerolineae bacterium]
MKPNLRWQILLAAVCLGLVGALLSFQVQTAGFCTISVPAAGGIFSEGMVGSPRYLNPLLAGSNPVDRELVDLIFDGLTRYDERGELVPSLARDWNVGADGLTVQIFLREGMVWADGTPVTAADVLFTYDLLKMGGEGIPEALTTFWQEIEIVATDNYTLLFTLPEPYAPFMAATTIGILPAHALVGVNGDGLAAAAFTARPWGTGPFMVAAENDWQATGRLRLVPNPQYWQRPFQIDALEFRFYPNIVTLIEAYQRGEVQAINELPSYAMPLITELPDARFYTATEPRYTQLLFNLSDLAPGKLPEVEARQALVQALDQEQLIAEALYGQALPLEGPYLPTSWAYNPNWLTDYEYNPEAAAATLAEVGWSLPPSETIRYREEVSLTLRLLYPDTVEHEAVVAELGRQWAAVGAGIEPLPVLPLELPNALESRGFDIALVDVIPGQDPDLYDFWSQEAIVRGQNYASWNNRRASEALEVGRQKVGRELRLPYYEKFLRLYDRDLPAVTLYQPVRTYVITSEIENVDIGYVQRPRERYMTADDWFWLYRNVIVSCTALDESASESKQ